MSQLVCFGRKWGAQDPECCGGLDPAFVNEKDGSRRRERCPEYTRCAAKTNENNVAQQQAQGPRMTGPAQTQTTNPQDPAQNWLKAVSGVVQGVAAAIPVRPPVHQPPPAPIQHKPNYQQPQTQYQPPYQQPQYQQHQQPQYQQQQQHYQGGMVHPSMAMQPWAVPMNTVMPGAQMPGYLAVPEPITKGQHWGARLGYSIARSMAKATGHTVANFFDYMTITPWPTPPDR